MNADTAYERILDALRDHGHQVIVRGKTSRAQCPAHDGTGTNLAITDGGQQVLLKCHSHDCHHADIAAALGLTPADLFNDPKGATYRYDDGRIVYRSPDKKFRQTGNTNGTPQLLHAAAVTAAITAGTPVYLVEGEKDAEAITTLGAIATSAPMGAGNVDKADFGPLTGGRVYVIPDQDEQGRDKWLPTVLAKLAALGAEVRVRAPRAGKDAADHIAAGYSLDELVAVEHPDTDALDIPNSWRPVDLTDVLNGTWTPAQPTVGSRRDGIGLFYPGKTHTISSESEAGKTWLALSAVIDELLHGNHVVYLDFEDDEGGITSRLLALQISPQVILDRFHYIRPSDPLGTGLYLDTLTHVLTQYQPTLAIVDGITEAMTLHGLDPLDNRDVAAFGRILPKRITLHGAAVVCLDHVTKSPDGRGRYALGGVHKLNGLDGAAYILECRQPFGIGITGKSTIRIAKDRPGRLRANSLPARDNLHWFGDLTLISHSDTFAEIEIEPPHAKDENFRPTHLMEKLWEIIDTKAGQKGISGRDVQAIAGGRTETNRAALTHLRLDGFITDTPHKVLCKYPPDGQEGLQ